MMILITSISSDTSTSQVIDWLLHHNVVFKRINTDTLNDINIDKVIYINGTNINEFSSSWYRRGRLKIDRSYFSDIQIERTVKYYIADNDTVLLQLIEYKLNQLRHINSYSNSVVNKLIILEKAKKNGLKTPEANLLKKIPCSSGKYIYKTINETGFISLKFSDFFVGTKEIENYTLKEFDTTLFQKKIEKKYELRIFYLSGRFWSMAIFSQSSEQTSVDFRYYNYEKPNRTVPFSLPKNIENKLDSLMKDCMLNCGSVDMIVSKDDEYYFLEINPVGQFGMVSFPCNYHLEKEIAKYLSNDERTI